MRTFLIFVVLAGLFSINLISCDGDGESGKGEEEFTVFGVTVKIIELQPSNPIFPIFDCPETANLKLSTQVNENNISGFAELIDFGNIGEPIEVSGSIQDSNFTLNPFSVRVSGGLTPTDIPRPIYLDLDIALFEGTFLNNEVEMPRHKIEGIVSGDIDYSLTGAPDCIASFTGQFSGLAKSPEGCVSRVELTLPENRDCPAETISNLCDDVGYLCEIPESMPPGDFRIGNTCADIDCFTIVCQGVEITNVQLSINGYISGNFVTSGEPISCFAPSGRL